MCIRDCAESVVASIPQAPSGTDAPDNRADKNARSTLPTARMPLFGIRYQFQRYFRIHPRSVVVVEVTLELSEDGMARLRAEAERHQISVDAVIEEWAASLPTENRPAKCQQPSLVAMGTSSSGRRAAEADDMLAERFGSDLLR